MAGWGGSMGVMAGGVGRCVVVVVVVVVMVLFIVSGGACGHI